MILFGNFLSFICCLICAVLHEMGHSFVGRKLGYNLNVITLMPYGAMLSGNNAPFSENDEIKIAIAGPIVNLILIVIVVFLNTIFSSISNYLYMFLWANIYTFCFNVLPVYPLDGGRIILALLCKFNGRVKAYKITRAVGFIITGIVFMLFFLSFMFKLNYMLGINALFMLIGLLDNDTEVYYQKLNNFEKFRFTIGKSIKLSADDTIFEAYRHVCEGKCNAVYIEQKNGKKRFTKDYISSKILTLPINTPLKEIWFVTE